jgi:HAD superfamily hydrolase (TIGR01458 family)
VSAGTGRVEGLLLDIDGVLTVSWEPLPGAIEAVERLRAAGLPFRLLTNTTELTRAQLAATLREAGFSFAPEEILTAPVVTAGYLRAEHPVARCLVLSPIDLTEDLEGVEMVEEGPDVVVIGGATEPFGAAAANAAYRAVLAGTPLVAMHGSLSWMAREGMMLDPCVMLVRAIEAATGRVAVVCGKPSPRCFREAAALLGVAPERTAMVGDDVANDVLAARAAGLIGVLVRTGKFVESDLVAIATEPGVSVLDSVADLPEWWEALPAGP